MGVPGVPGGRLSDRGGRRLGGPGETSRSAGRRKGRPDRAPDGEGPPDPGSERDRRAAGSIAGARPGGAESRIERPGRRRGAERAHPETGGGNPGRGVGSEPPADGDVRPAGAGRRGGGACRGGKQRCGRENSPLGRCPAKAGRRLPGPVGGGPQEQQPVVPGTGEGVPGEIPGGGKGRPRGPAAGRRDPGEPDPGIPGEGGRPDPGDREGADLRLFDPPGADPLDDVRPVAAHGGDGEPRKGAPGAGRPGSLGGNPAPARRRAGRDGGVL